MLHKKLVLALAALALPLSACGTMDRLSSVGKAPGLKPIENVSAPQRQASISHPQPDVSFPAPTANSLWRPGARAFFKDQRAAQVGDIMTVVIDISDTASVDNTTTRTRNNSEKADVSNLLGLESQLSKVLPKAVDPSSLASLGSSSSSTGSGKVARSEAISLTVAAIVTGVLPNGNLVIQGRQEVRVNFEVRELLIAGIVRPEDISSANTIQHTQIAEARISYGGRGQLTDVQQARWGQQVYDAIFPF